MFKPQCVSTSLCLRLYSPRERIRKAVSLSEKQEDVDRYKEMKREKTHRDRTGCVWSAEDFLLSGSQKFSRIQCRGRPSQKKKKKKNATTTN